MGVQAFKPQPKSNHNHNYACSAETWSFSGVDQGWSPPPPFIVELCLAIYAEDHNELCPSGKVTYNATNTYKPSSNHLSKVCTECISAKSYPTRTQTSIEGVQDHDI